MVKSYIEIKSWHIVVGVIALAILAIGFLALKWLGCQSTLFRCGIDKAKCDLFALVTRQNCAAEYNTCAKGCI